MFRFLNKRPDGYLVEDGDPMNLIMPYMMTSRIESQVFYSYHIPYEAISKFIKEQRKLGNKITFFNVLVAAIKQTVQERPHLNRFISGRRLYQRHNFEVLYVVKDSLTDEANESIARVNFSAGDDLHAVAQKMNRTNELLRAGRDNLDDKAIRLLLKLPRFMIRAIFALYSWLDYFGIAPKVAVEQLPFYSSVFISHLGTIGGDAVFHHLYEMGTCSIFLTVGRLTKRPLYVDDKLTLQKTIELAFTIDERICDGYYLVKSLKRLNYYLQNPYELEKVLLQNSSEQELSTTPDGDCHVYKTSEMPMMDAILRLKRYLAKPVNHMDDNSTSVEEDDDSSQE